MIITKGCDINIKTNEGYTALEYAKNKYIYGNIYNTISHELSRFHFRQKVTIVK